MAQVIAETQVNRIQFLLNGIYTAVKNIVPSDFVFEKPQRLQQKLHMTHGVLIGTIGDMKGSLIVTGSGDIFSEMAKRMYGMELDCEMLLSFSGEFTNMIAGSLCTIMDLSDIRMDITSPTTLKEDVFLSAFEHAFQLSFLLENETRLIVYYLIDHE